MIASSKTITNFYKIRDSSHFISNKDRIGLGSIELPPPKSLELSYPNELSQLRHMIQRKISVMPFLHMVKNNGIYSIL
jgi:hypothetical protein